MATKIQIPDNMKSVWQLNKLGTKPKEKYSKKNYDRQRSRVEQQKKTLAIIAKHEPNLLKKTTGLCLTKEQIDFLLDKIYTKFQGISRKHPHNFFIKGLARGVEKLDWDIDVPSPLTVISHDIAPFTPHKLAQHNALKTLNKLFLQSLETPPRLCGEPGFKLFLAGQIIFSAAINGGLLHQEWLGAIPAALKKHKIMADNHYVGSEKKQSATIGLIWLELSFTRKRQKASSKEYSRRWFPDPITSLLLFKWLKHFGHQWLTYPADFTNEPSTYQKWQGKKKWEQSDQKETMPPLDLLRNILASYLLTLGLNFGNQPRLHEFISACRVHLGFHLPQYLVRYASSVDKAVSLTPQTWARLRTDQRIKEFKPWKKQPKSTENNELNQSCKTIAEIDIELQSSDRYPDQHTKMQQLRKCLRKGDNKPVFEAIENFLRQGAQLTPILQLIAHWCMERLNNSSFGKELMPSSLSTYFSTFVPELVACGYDFDLKSADVESWENLYDTVLRAKDSEDQIKRKVDRLTSFHLFLTQAINAPEIDLPDLAGISRNVNVNIITHKEYHRIKAHLLSNDNYPIRLQQIHLLLLILGFHCGLRRSEAWKLLLGDVQYDQEVTLPDERITSWVELLLRANHYRKLKTIKSIRRLPLFNLLSVEEQDAIIAWQHLRTEENGASPKRNLLLCLAGEDTITLYENTTFKVITLAMETITGDPDILFQHLRHSFATFTQLRLIEPDHPNVFFPEWAMGSIAISPDTHQHDNKLSSPATLRSHLINSDQSEVTASRRLLYGLSLLCGHLDPEETLATYIHLLDYLLGQELSTANNTEMSIDQQAYLLDTSKGSLKSTCSQRGIKVDSPLDLLNIRIKKIVKQFKDPILATMTTHEKIPEFKMESPVKLGYPTLYQLHKIFSRHYRNPDDNNTKGFLQHAFSEERINDWIAIANAIAEMKTKTGNKRTVFSEEEAKKAKKKNACRRRKTLVRKKRSVMGSIPGYCPSYPHGELTGKDAQLFYKGILKFHEQNQDLTLSVLRLYLSTTSKNYPEAKLCTNQERIDFVTFLKEIGVPQKRIRINLKVVPNMLIKTQKSYWSKLLDLPETNITTNSKYTQNRHGRFSHGTPLIWVQGFQSQTIGKENKPVTWQTTGLRYAMYMAAVVLYGNKKLAKKRLQEKDIYVVLKLMAISEEKSWLTNIGAEKDFIMAIEQDRNNTTNLANDIGMNLPELKRSLNRSVAAHLAIAKGEAFIPHIENFKNYLIHNLHHDFPAKYGQNMKGLPTAAHPLSPIKGIKEIGQKSLLVWPVFLTQQDSSNKLFTDLLSKGVTIEPLYKSAPEAATKDQTFWKILALADLLRINSKNEREFAIDEIKKILSTWN